MYSVQIAVSDGTLTRISLSIEYFEKDDITLYRNLDTTPMVLGTDWQWDGDTTIQLLTGIPVPNGEYITVRRNTNIDRAFNIYDGGAAFSRDTLDENFRQMIYLAQEFTEGNGLTGLFFPLDMHGFKITNLGDGTDPKDAINKGQLDVVGDRVSALEDSFITNTVSYPWYQVLTTATDTLVPGYNFDKAALYIDGAAQIPEYSYIVVSNTILLAEEVPAGTKVFARLGEDTDSSTGYVTTTQFQTAVDTLTDANASTQAELDALEVTVSGQGTDITALQSGLSTANTNIANKAAKGANNDITSLNALTTAITIAQGGTGATTAAGARTALGLGNSATRDVGTTAGTVLAGDALGRLLNVSRVTANGTYALQAGTKTVIVEVQGGGGAGGGCPATSGGQAAAGGGGNAGAYAKVILSSAQFGASQSIVIGTGGAGVAGAAGGAGGTTSIGTLVSCPGGAGGQTTGAIAPVSGATFAFPAAKTSPTVSSGTALSVLQSATGEYGICTTTTTLGSAGGNSPLGSSGPLTSSPANGSPASVGYGAGGGGAASSASNGARAGGNGTPGVVIIYEFS